LKELKIRSIYSFISYMTSLIILYEKTCTNMRLRTSATGGSKITISSKMTCLGSRNTAASRSLDRWKRVTKTHVLLASQRSNWVSCESRKKRVLPTRGETVRGTVRTWFQSGPIASAGRIRGCDSYKISRAEKRTAALSCVFSEIENGSCLLLVGEINRARKTSRG